MKSRRCIVSCLFALRVVAGCATTKITNQQPVVTGQLPRPDRIWVYDFAATAAEVPTNSVIAGQASATPQTAEQLATGRQLGAELASQLVQQIQGMGLRAARAGAGTAPQINDIVLRGYLLSIEEGSEVKRLANGRSTVEGRAQQTVRKIAAQLKPRFQEQGWIS